MGTAAEGEAPKKRGRRKKVPAAEEQTEQQTELEATPPKKRKKAKKEEPPAEEPKTVAEHQEDRKKEAKLRLRAVRDLRDRDVEIFVELAEQLYEIQDKKLFHFMINPAHGKQYQSFQEFAQNETGYSERKANYLLQIWKYYVVEHSREFLDDVKHLGWAKLKEMIDYIDSDNKSDIVRMIDGTDGEGGLSVKQLQAHVKEARAAKKKKDAEKKSKGPEDPADSHSGKDTKKADRPSKINYQLFPQQKENLETAIEQAKKIKETESDAEAIDLISLDFLSHHLEPSPESTDLLLQNVESALGGRVVHLKSGSPTFVSSTTLPEDKSERLRFLLEALEVELGCDLIAVKDKEVIHYNSDETDDPAKAVLSMIENVLGVQLFAVKGEEIIFIHPDLEPYVLGGDDED